MSEAAIAIRFAKIQLHCYDSPSTTTAKTIDRKHLVVLSVAPQLQCCKLFATPRQINQVNLDAIELGLLILQDFDRVGQFFRQMQVFDMGYINYANEQGSFFGVERLDDGGLLIHESQATRPNITTIYQPNTSGDRIRIVDTLDDPDRVQDEGWYAAAARAQRPV